METKAMVKKVMDATIALTEGTATIPVLQAKFQLALAQRKFKVAEQIIPELEKISKAQVKWAKEIFAVQNGLLEELE